MTSAFIESLPVLVMHPHSRCNCRCTMCDIWKTTEAREITPDDLQNQLASIDNLSVQWVVFSGGEALMHSDLWRLCTPLRERKIRITLLSSGLLLKRYADSIVRYVDDVIVSLDGPAAVHNSIRGVPGAFEMLASGVKTLKAIKPGFPISARCTVLQQNFGHLIETAETARTMDLRSISFLAADIESKAFNRDGWSNLERQQISLSHSDLAQLKTQIGALVALGSCGSFISESPLKLQRIVEHFQAFVDQTQPVAPVCNAPWTSAVIESDGAVRPCFFHPPIGNLQNASLENILNGPQAIAFRSSLNVATNPTCRKCVCSLHWKESATQ